MTKVCPNPIPWNAVYQRLLHVGEARSDLPKPPVPLVLNGWVFSIDIDKIEKWQETVQWAKAAGCSDITSSLLDDEFYQTEEITSSRFGPLGGPMHRSWDFEAKQKSEQNVLAAGLQRLWERWSNLAAGFSAWTHPVGFTGEKSRRLVVAASAQVSPSWGTWEILSNDEGKGRTFTAFRQAINEALDPHEVDHIDFVIESTRSSD